MAKKRSFLGFLASLFILVFTTNVFAAQYTCDSQKQYTSCKTGYYLTGSSCNDCKSANNTTTTRTNITNGTRVQTCTGTYLEGNGIGGAGGASAQCKGCSQSTYTCECNSGYSPSDSTANCSCVADNKSVKCDEGQYIQKGATTCSACPAGSYCAGGTHSVPSGGANDNMGITGTCPAGKYSNAGAKECTTCPAGSFCTGGANLKACSSLAGVNPSGGTYTSAQGSTASTACKYTAPTKTINGCASVTSNTVTYTGAAWPASTYSVTANAGWIIANNNTASATCTQCNGAVYSAGGAATSCSACPTQTTGWTRGTGTGWTAYSSCYETQTPANCSSGSVKHTASSASAWNNTVTLVTTLKSNAGYYASNTATSCTICPPGSYCAANATAPTACSSLANANPSGGTYTSAQGSTASTACKYTAPTKTITGCASVTSNTVTYTGATWPASTYNVTANAGWYIANNGTANATCSACGDNSSTEAGNTSTTCTCTSPTPTGYSANGERTGPMTSTNGCKAVTYNITYELNGGEWNGGTQATGVPATYTYNTGATISGTPTKQYYTFDGWCTFASLTDCKPTQTIAADATGDKTFYAKWSKTMIACQPGMYWDKDAQQLLDCTSGNYCPGDGNVWMGDDTGCITNCPGQAENATGTSNKDPQSDPKANNIGQCYIDFDTYGEFQNGSASARCFYSPNGPTDDQGYYTQNCTVHQAKSCKKGYYYNAVDTETGCIKVGYGFYSPDGDTSRTACASGETTSRDNAGSADECISCPAGSFCDPEEVGIQSCPETHKYSDAGARNIFDCYDVCKIDDSHIISMTGHNYYPGKPENSTCAAASCIAGYYPDGTKCTICPAGSYCQDTADPNKNSGNPKSCSSLPSGHAWTEWTQSESGSPSPELCTATCAVHVLDGGTAYPINDTVTYNTLCEYYGLDNVGNSCDIDIAGNMCITTSCKPSYEMVNGKCVACNREHALTYDDAGNCQVKTCESGWHPDGDICAPDIKDCNPMPVNATSAEQRWDFARGVFGICMITECDPGFHIASNACVADIQDCEVNNGIGKREWDHKIGAWGDCVATSCDAGYTNDPFESNEPTEQCGECRNKYGIDGERAASVYSRECTIAACMYQGELYNLENNECVPICKTYADETGSMQWNPLTHKCDRTCNRGYTMW